MVRPSNSANAWYIRNAQDTLQLRMQAGSLRVRKNLSFSYDVSIDGYLDLGSQLTTWNNPYPSPLWCVVTGWDPSQFFGNGVANPRMMRSYDAKSNIYDGVEYNYAGAGEATTGALQKNSRRLLVPPLGRVDDNLSGSGVRFSVVLCQSLGLALRVGT